MHRDLSILFYTVFFHCSFLEILVHIVIYFFHCFSRQSQVSNLIYDLWIKGAFSFDTITSWSFSVGSKSITTPHVQYGNNNYYIPGNTTYTRNRDAAEATFQVLYIYIEYNQCRLNSIQLCLPSTARQTYDRA